MNIQQLFEGTEPKLPGAPSGIKIMTPQQFVANASDVPSEDGVTEGNDDHIRGPQDRFAGDTNTSISTQVSLPKWQIGLPVFVKHLGQKGEIASLGNDSAIVDVGMRQYRVPLDGLRRYSSQGVTEGVAETLPMNDAVKVLRQYGADNFKTTSNELHFYKNGRPLSVDLILNDDATRSVSLSQLNSATRKLKGQGVAESSEQRWRVTVGNKSGTLSHTKTFTGTKEQAIKQAVTRFATTRNPVVTAELVKQDVKEDSNQQLSIQQLAAISDEALDKAYGYGRSSPGNTFGWQANLKSAAYAKQMIDKGVNDIEAIGDAIHKGWNVTAKAFVQNPDQFDDTEKLRAAGKLEAKLQQREKLMNIAYAQLSDEEKEKDRVVARAMLQAITGGLQGVTEGASDFVSDAIEGLRMAKPGLEQEDFLDELYMYIENQYGQRAAAMMSSAGRDDYDEWYDSYLDNTDRIMSESEEHLERIRKLSGLDEATKLPAQSRPFGGQEFQDYMKRIAGSPDLDKEGNVKVDKKGIEKYVSGKTKSDRYKMPYIHRSSVISYLSPDGKKYDEDAVKATLAIRPKALLKQNEKMKHSNGEFEQFFNVGFAALTGIALDEQTNNLIIVNTCPGAGSCKVDCFAMKGGKVQFQGPWQSDGRILTYLLNDPDGFFNQLSSEITKEERAGQKGDKKFPNGWEVTVRWHDAGDFFSPEYLDLALKMAAKHPNVKFYAYTKMAAAALAKKPANFIINWSEGAHTSQEKQVKAQDPNLDTTKNSRIVPDNLFQDLLVKDEKKNLVKGDAGQWQVQSDKLPELKQRLAKEYGLSSNSILSYDEYMAKRKSIPTGMKYNVIVAPGEGDISANDPGVISTLLLKH